MNKNYFLICSLLLVLSFSFVSSASVRFYFSEKCPYCVSVKPLIESLSKQKFSTDWQWKFINIDKTKESNISAVPTVIIKTTDCRRITLLGEEQIRKKLKCEVQEMTTKECSTSIFINNKTNSYFD